MRNEECGIVPHGAPRCSLFLQKGSVIMDYSKKTWEAGDTISSEALNNIENALAALAAAQGPVEAEGTLVTDEQTGKMTITLNKMAGELYEAACAGKLLKLSMQMTMVDDKSGTDYVVDITKIVTFTATRIVAESVGAVAYSFDARIGDSDDGDKLLCSADIGENDTVVLTEV